MLVLSRKKHEQIQIGKDITITVCDVHGNLAVRLGITAPRDVPIYRQELRDEFLRRGAAVGGVGGGTGGGTRWVNS